jgi:hypothetical protein
MEALVIELAASLFDSHEHISVLNPSFVSSGWTKRGQTEVLPRADVKLGSMPRAGHNKSVYLSTGQWVARVRTDVVKSEDLAVVPEQQNGSVLHDYR